MAEFGIQATQLSPGQGAGANVVAPVQAMDTGRNPILGVVSSIADVFAKGIDSDNKEQAAKRKASIIGEYTGKIKRLTDGLEQGELDAARVSVESKKLFSQFTANFPEFVPELSAAAKALTEYSSLSTADIEIKEVREARKRNISDAEKDGFIFYSDMAPDVEQAQLVAHKTGVRANKLFQEAATRRTEVRTEDTFQRTIQDREDKEQAFTLINEVAGANVDSFKKLASDVGLQVRSGKMTPDQARLTLGSRMADIKGALAAAARVNPSLAEPYVRIFDDLNRIGQTLSDPAQSSKDAEDEYKALIAKTKLLAVRSSPKARAAIAANEMFSNNPQLLLQTTNEALEAIAIMGNTPLTETAGVPQGIGGDKEVETETLKLMKGALEGLASGKIPKKDVAELQASNSTNHILTQIGAMADKGAIDPERAYNIVKTISEPAFGKFSEAGKLDKGATQAAKKTVQIFWRKAGDDVMTRLNKSPLSPTGDAPFIPGTQTRNPIQFKHMVDIGFEGSGIVFVPKTGKMGSIAQVQAQERTLGELKGAQTLLNQSLRAAAHLDGTTDYKKYWNENKHLMFPEMFQAPEKKVEKSPKFDTEAQMKEGATTGGEYKGLTRDTLAEILADLESGKLTKEQQEELRKTLKQLKEANAETR